MKRTKMFDVIAVLFFGSLLLGCAKKEKVAQIQKRLDELERVLAFHEYQNQDSLWIRLIGGDVIEDLRRSLQGLEDENHLLKAKIYLLEQSVSGKGAFSLRKDYSDTPMKVVATMTLYKAQILPLNDLEKKSLVENWSNAVWSQISSYSIIKTEEERAKDEQKSKAIKPVRRTWFNRRYKHIEKDKNFRMDFYYSDNPYGDLSKAVKFASFNNGQIVLR